MQEQLLKALGPKPHPDAWVKRRIVIEIDVPKLEMEPRRFNELVLKNAKVLELNGAMLRLVTVEDTTLGPHK